MIGFAGLGCTVRGLGEVFTQEAGMSTRGTVVLIGFLLCVVGGLTYFFVKNRPNTAGDADPMPSATRRLLAIYLLLVGLSLMIFLWQIGTVDFSDAGLKIESSPITNAGSCPSTAPVPATTPGVNSTTTSDAAAAERRPILFELFPQLAVGAVPVVYITACGSEFTIASKLRFNQKEQPTFFVDKYRI
jgi:hypothetical protein